MYCINDIDIHINLFINKFRTKIRILKYQLITMTVHGLKVLKCTLYHRHRQSEARELIYKFFYNFVLNENHSTRNCNSLRRVWR